MRSHPGGDDQTRELFALSALKPGSAVLDMGAGSGASILIAEGFGFNITAVDRDPLSEEVLRGDYLEDIFEPGTFDGVLSQCSFYASGDQEKAISQACRFLKKGGILMLADIFFEDAKTLLEGSGFEVLSIKDMTSLWRDYYLEAVWRGSVPDCFFQSGRKASYKSVICRKV